MNVNYSITFLLATPFPSLSWENLSLLIFLNIPKKLVTSLKPALPSRTSWRCSELKAVILPWSCSYTDLNACRISSEQKFQIEWRSIDLALVKSYPLKQFCSQDWLIEEKVIPVGKNRDVQFWQEPPGIIQIIDFWFKLLQDQTAPQVAGVKQSQKQHQEAPKPGQKFA